MYGKDHTHANSTKKKKQTNKMKRTFILSTLALSIKVIVILL